MELKHFAEHVIYNRNKNHYLFAAFVLKEVGLEIFKNGEQSATSLIGYGVSIRTFYALPSRTSYIIN
jgi:hypothetical protein